MNKGEEGYRFVFILTPPLRKLTHVSIKLSRLPSRAAAFSMNREILAEPFLFSFYMGISSYIGVPTSFDDRML